MTKPKAIPTRTNEEQIRSLRGERLAEFLDRHAFCPRNPIECETPVCRVCIRQWLKKEAEK